MTRPLSELTACPFCKGRGSLPDGPHVILTVAEYERMTAELVALRAEREAVRNAALEEAVNEICANEGADLLTMVKAIRALAL